VTEWKAAETVGWRHGRVPTCPAGVSTRARKTWKLWFSSWWASFWEIEDVPLLELAIRLWDATDVDPVMVTKFQPLADKLGLTPKGRFDLRWKPPESTADKAGSVDPTPAPVRRLRVVDTA
jgi:hypothetical protein